MGAWKRRAIEVSLLVADMLGEWLAIPRELAEAPRIA